MTKQELLQRLQDEKVPENCYSLEGGLPNDRLCLEKLGLAWLVYYSETGERYEEMFFTSEDEACDYFHTRVKEMTT